MNDSPWVLMVVGWVMVAGILGTVAGAVEAADKWEKGGCTYESIASYFPSRVLACELARRRWPRNEYTQKSEDILLEVERLLGGGAE